MYQIKCDNYILYDPRNESLVVTSPKLALETNTVGKGSFTIHSGHPYYDCLSKLKSVFTVLEDGQPIFRGRMTDDSKDWNISKKVELEGALAYLNDSIIEPFAFPEDFTSNADYVTAAASGNVVQFFLNWLITQHNSQVESYQKFKLGNVTVADANNYINRSSEEYLSTWEVISGKLFKTNLGGKLCIRYEADGNYIDYLSEFAATNSQAIEFGENLLDLVTDSSAIDTYSAILPIGKDGLTIESVADGDLTSDLVKSGKIIYSRSAKTSYGYICKTVKWDDVTEAVNLKTKAMNLLSGTGVKLANTITVKAVDLHCTDAQIASFRINRKVTVNSTPHGYSGAFDLTKLDIDILSPQNTKLTLGETLLSLADINAKDKWENIEKVEKVTKDITEINDSLKETNSNVSALIQRVTTTESSITQQSNQIALKVSQSDMQTAIGNIQIGGRNILLNSSFEKDFTNWDNSGGYEIITLDGIKCAHYKSTTLNQTKYCTQSLWGRLEPNTKYTLSGWVRTDNIVKGTTNFTIMFYINGYYNDNGSSKWFGYVLKPFTTNAGIGSWEYITYTFATDDKVNIATSLNFYIYTRDFTGDVYVRNIKLEKGDKSTDWTPAPEDVDTQIEATAENLQNAIGEVNATLLNTESKITQTANEILSTVSQTYTTTGALNNLQTTLNSSISQAASSLQVNFNTQIGNLANTVNGNQQTLQEYIRFSGANIELGKSDSPFITKLSNTKLSFMQDNSEIAYMSNNKMYITNAEVTNKLTVGNSTNGYWDWVPRANGNLSLKWREN